MNSTEQYNPYPPERRKSKHEFKITEWLIRHGSDQCSYQIYIGWASLFPGAVAIPAPVAYIKVVAVKRLVWLCHNPCGFLVGTSFRGDTSYNIIQTYFTNSILNRKLDVSFRIYKISNYVLSLLQHYQFLCVTVPATCFFSLFLRFSYLFLFLVIQKLIITT